MLMSLSELVERFGMRITGVLHVGAHLAEEAEAYQQLGIEDVWWVEALPTLDLLDKISRFPTHQLVQGLVYETVCELPFNVTNYDGMSSSIYEFGTHTQFSPDTVFVDRVTLTSTTIDAIVVAHDVVANFLNMDIQGAELSALKGAKEYLPTVDYIMTEVNQAEVYIGCTQIGQLDEFLSDFQRVAVHWVTDQGWGDALYVRTAALPKGMRE